MSKPDRYVPVIESAMALMAHVRATDTMQIENVQRIHDELTDRMCHDWNQREDSYDKAVRKLAWAAIEAFRAYQLKQSGYYRRIIQPPPVETVTEVVTR